jgi:hypothetical protein
MKTIRRRPKAKTPTAGADPNPAEKIAHDLNGLASLVHVLCEAALAEGGDGYLGSSLDYIAQKLTRLTARAYEVSEAHRALLLAASKQVA